MVVSVVPCPSNCPAAGLLQAVATPQPCKLLDGMLKPVSSCSTLDNQMNSTLLAPLDTRQAPVKQQLQHLLVDEEPETEMDLGDGYSTDSSSICSSVDTSSYMSFLDESENLNDRRQAMLDLSISKIQTMNASNASFSLRKSLLIYNVMKSLQRELDDDACGVRGYNSLTEREVGAPVVSDVEMLEEASDVNAWERRCPDLGPDFMTYHTQGYSWLLDSSQFVGTAQNDANQDSEKCNGMYTVMGRSDSMDSEGIWSNPTANGNDSSVFMDDYLRMLGAWEDENCNPLTNCNLTQAEIMNMFNLPAYHLNSEVASQA